MTDDRDLFLAEQIGRTTPPDHGPTFWADLEDTLSMTTSTHAPPSERPWRSPRYLGLAAAIVILAGFVVGVIIAQVNGDPTSVETGPANPGDESPAPTSGPEQSTTSSTATSTSSTTSTGPERQPLDLSGAVELTTSLDGTLRLMAVPDPDEFGCEGMAPVWQLYWADSEDAGYPAAENVFANAPTTGLGSDGRLAFLDRCEESTSLYIGREMESGVLGELAELTPVGWEAASIREVSWQQDSDVIILTVSQQGPSGELEFHRLEVDSLTGEVLASEPVDPDEGEPPTETCSAQELTDPVISSGQPWSGQAAEIQQAALDCDYERLDELAGPAIRSSFGAPGDFAEQLRTDEGFGYEPMKKLVLLLGADPGEYPSGEYLAWPAFFACETTCEMDEDEVRRLGYTDEDIAGFREFGGYIGYRVLFAPNADGTYTWTVFVAGD